MVWNEKIVFRVFIISLIFIFLITCYFVFFSSGQVTEKIFESIGFEDSESSEDTPAVPLPEDSLSGATGLASGNSGGSGGSGGSSENTNNGEGAINLRFCTFDAYHVVTGDVPCRCGFSAVCYTEGSNCDASFNNGEGFCS
ncbi:hypothetical protein FJZ21_02465 [Candidatus Pacearchaeota archaeon]|nr:hypothetical protein [Candidatus Pacearchaeota archaeon]